MFWLEDSVSLYKIRRRIAQAIDMPVATNINQEGFYVSHRFNKTHDLHYFVQVRRHGDIIFQERIPESEFPSDHLIAQLMLIA